MLLACGGSRSATPSLVVGGSQSVAVSASPADVATGARAADFVWADSLGVGRAQVVWFRRDLLLDGPVEAARLRLFADSRYLLFVNGEVIASGPALVSPASRIRRGRSLVSLATRFEHDCGPSSLVWDVHLSAAEPRRRVRRLG
ncbi:MAG TPA: hypothetical protein VG963_18955, partial [Polyangiaceae bacterium]|nr:hypothetical protein [Polyangiaceae bacterium]